MQLKRLIIFKYYENMCKNIFHIKPQHKTIILANMRQA